MDRRRMLLVAGSLTLSGLAGCLGDDDGEEDNNTPTEEIPTGTLTGTLAVSRDLVVENLHENPQTISVTVTTNDGEQYHSKDYELDSSETVTEEDFVTQKGIYIISISVDLNTENGDTPTGTEDGNLTKEFQWVVDNGSGDALVQVTDAGTLLTSGKM